MTNWRAKVTGWVVVLVLLGIPGRALAQETLPVYVSDQFKAVARKAFRQLVGKTIANACPETKPLCTIVADRLAQGFDAALAKDEQGLKSALAGLFSDSAIAALVEFGISDLMAEGQPPAQTAAVASLARCVTLAIVGRASSADCTFEGLLIPSFLGALPPVDCSAPASAHRCRLEESLRDRQRLSPSDILRTLADVASTEAVGRVDLRIYLLRLASLADYGVEDGLTDAVLAFLLGFQPPYAIRSLIDYRPGGTPWEIFDPARDSKWRDAIAGCQLDPKAFNAWADARQVVVAELRRAYLSGGKADTSKLDALLDYRCSHSQHARTIADLRNHVRYVVTPVKVQALYERYAVPGLVAAAVLDFLRTSDAQALEVGLRKALVYAGAQVAALSLTYDALARESTGGEALSTANRVTTKRVLESCEGRMVGALLGVRLVPQGDCETLHGTPKPALAKLAIPAMLPDGKELAAKGQELQQAFSALLEASGSATFDGLALQRFDAGSLKRAVLAFSEGRSSSAHRNLIRLGVDFLAGQLNERVTALVGGDEGVCMASTRTVSVFQGSDAACAIHILFKAAYRPIADYVGQGGFDAEGTQKLASSTYRALLGAPGIDRSPLILNLGLGASYVVGDASIWGTSGYAALTLVEKFGVAFIKHSWESTRLEWGLFAGGFLDALIRSVAQEGKDQRNWLLGMTVGLTRVAGTDFGLELHVGAAMPFDLTAKTRYGLVTGLAVVVPFTFLFEAEN